MVEADAGDPVSAVGKWRMKALLFAGAFPCTKIAAVFKRRWRGVEPFIRKGTQQKLHERYLGFCPTVKFESDSRDSTLLSTTIKLDRMQRKVKENASN
jgi:hypothetical protein